MLYGQIKPYKYNVNVWKKINNNHFKHSISLCDYELFTMSEIKKYGIPEKCYDVVNYPKNESYICFGVRFNKMQDSFRFNK